MLLALIKEMVQISKLLNELNKKENVYTECCHECDELVKPEARLNGNVTSNIYKVLIEYKCSCGSSWKKESKIFY